MAEYTLRRATEADARAIKQLIHLVDINPMSLDWRRFVIAVDTSDRLIGCGQLKLHGKNIVELASIATQPEQRGKGIASAIIDQLLAEAPRPLYLTCLSHMEPFYQRWGFRALTPKEMPGYFRRLAQAAGMLSPLLGNSERMLVMELK
jgi:N-acetylglutamate synthase-like GNAT family acetyltransferase